MEFILFFISCIGFFLATGILLFIIFVFIKIKMKKGEPVNETKIVKFKKRQ